MAASRSNRPIHLIKRELLLSRINHSIDEMQEMLGLSDEEIQTEWNSFMKNEGNCGDYICLNFKQWLTR